MTPPDHLGEEKFVEVPPERLTRWVERFVDSHGQAEVTPLPSGFALAAADGSSARLELLVTSPTAEVDTGAWRAAASLAARATATPPVLLVAVRRGGWAVGVADGGGERVGKAGRGYVQARTAAGGTSQSRYARRRGNQAAKLADGAAGALQRITRDPEAMAGVAGVVVAGDRDLCRDVLAEAGSDLPVVGVLAVGEPRRVTLTELAVRVRAIRVHVRNAGPTHPVATTPSPAPHPSPTPQLRPQTRDHGRLGGLRPPEGPDRP